MLFLTLKVKVTLQEEVLHIVGELQVHQLQKMVMVKLTEMERVIGHRNVHGLLDHILDTTSQNLLLVQLLGTNPHLVLCQPILQASIHLPLLLRAPPLDLNLLNAQYLHIHQDLVVLLLHQHLVPH